MGIYGAGKAFNLRYAQNTYVPNRGMNIRQARQPIMFGGHCHCAPQNTNVTINNGPTGFWGFMSGLFGGLFGGGGMMGMGMGGGLFGGLFSNLFGGGMGSFNPFGMINAQQAQPQQLPGNQDKLANLKTLYPNHNIVSDGNDKYSATDKEGHLIGKGLSYEDMCEALSKAKSEEKEKVENDDNKNGGKVKDDDTGKVKDDNTGKVKDDNGKVKDNSGTRRSGGSSKAGGSNKADGTQGAGNKNNIDKTKPVKVNISFSIHSNTTNSGTATVTMPDGTRYTASTGASLTHNRAMNALADDIMAQLKKAGWTNVTLVNQNFKFSKGGQTQNTQKAQGAQKSQGAQKAQGTQKTQWTAAEKAKPRKLTINFSIHTMRGNNGTATVKTPDGKTYTVQTGMSLTHQRAMEDLSNKMKATLSQQGWTNVTLVNQNFNWSD